MARPPIRFGLVGLGGHGRRLQEAVAEVSGVHVGAVYDPDAGEADAAARRFGCEASASFEALIARDDLDAVVLVTPNAVHRSQAEAAFAAGLDVFVEKPIANTVADGRAMVEAAEHAGRGLMVGHNIRFGRAARTAKRMLEAGTLGEVVSAEIHYSADNVQKGTHEGWRFQPGQCPLLPVMQLGIHAIDLVHYLLGPVERAVARARSLLTAPGIVDHVAGLLTLENGLSATVVSNYCTPDLFQVRLASTKGILLVDWIPHRLTLLPRGNRTAHPEIHDFSGYEGEDLIAEIEAFAESIRTRTPPETTGRVGLQALAVVEAMARSAQDGKEQVVVTD
jgi:predicted dehydrogenase